MLFLIIAHLLNSGTVFLHRSQKNLKRFTFSEEYKMHIKTVHIDGSADLVFAPTPAFT